MWTATACTELGRHHGAGRQQQTEVLDGPYAESKEQLAGYYMIDVPDPIPPCPGRHAARRQS